MPDDVPAAVVLDDNEVDAVLLEDSAVAEESDEFDADITWFEELSRDKMDPKSSA